jgi:hypothetical protein
MSVSEFVSHFDIPLEERATNDVFNCLSLEVSDSALGDLIEPPAVARKLCWVNNVWPHSVSEWESKPPQVQKYCIMSMKDSFTGKDLSRAARLGELATFGKIIFAAICTKSSVKVLNLFFGDQ